MNLRLLLSALVLTLSLQGCATPMLQSTEVDRAQGEEAARMVAEQMGIIEAPDLTGYIERVGGRMVDELDKRLFSYTFRIVDQQEPNAFSVPGGQVFVSRGLLALVMTEDELASVLAHEVMHVERRHSAKQQARQRLPQLLTLPGNVVGSVVSRDLGAVMMMPGALVGATMGARYSRGHEFEADELGQTLAATAGYDPNALVAILNRIEAQVELATGSTSGPHFFDTHPTTDRRATELSVRAESLAWTQRTAEAGRPGAAMDELRGLIVGKNPAHGVFRDQAFLHPDMGFTLEFPAEWEPINTPMVVGAVAPSRDAAIVIMAESVDANAEQVGASFVQALTKEHRVTPERAEPVQIGEWPGYLITLADRSGRRAAYLHLLWVDTDQALLRLTGAGSETHQDALRQAAKSLRPLRKEERASITRTVLDIAEAREGESLERLGRRTGNVWDLRQTVVANDLDPDARLRRGHRVKIAIEVPFFVSER